MRLWCSIWWECFAELSWKQSVDTGSCWLVPQNSVRRERGNVKTRSYEALSLQTSLQQKMLSIVCAPFSCQFSKDWNWENSRMILASKILSKCFLWLSLLSQFCLLAWCLRTWSISRTAIHEACQFWGAYAFILFLLRPQSGQPTHN